MWQPCARVASMSGPDAFTFLGVRRTLSSGGDWNRIDWPRLWLYNLHYFDDLMAEGATERLVWHRALVNRWVVENPPGKGVGWEPYPTSLRIVNWIKWALAGNVFDEEMRISLAIQTCWLRQRLEIHLLGNHLWANAKALVFAGTFFQGEEADRWRAKGLSLLRRELDEQVLADGGHFERSPMYHAIVLEDVLDLIQLAEVFQGVIPERDVARWRATTTRMLRWLRVMTHPDGEIAFFNDTAFGIAPTYVELADYARAIGAPVTEEPFAPLVPLQESGYVRMEVGPAVLIADVGEIGPDYLPGHAHADTLSFELSLGGERVLANGGTSTYEPGDERLWQRGTAAHNTVEVNRQNSSEVWGSFRVARRARPLDVAWGEENGELWLRAAHDGYARLRSVGRVERRWRLSARRLLIEDRVAGSPKVVLVRFHAPPTLVFEQENGCCGQLHREAASVRWSATEAAAARIVADTWHPRFGKSESCQTLEFTLNKSSLNTEFSWE